MSSYRVVEHKVPCQHLREYPAALAYDEEDVLHLAVKQYIPLDNPNPQPGDVTIIAAHANGFPKELYEPLWEDLIPRTQKHGFRIRSIWMADVSQQGMSGVLNENLLGNDPAWFDHSRDLLHLINIKRDQMPRPIMGIGHSMGGAQLVNLSFFHPTLFTSFILLDPVIQLKSAEDFRDGTPNIAGLSTFRRDIWPSRAEAAKSFKRSPFYQTWDTRVLDRWVKYGLRDLPTPLHHDQQSSNKPPQVTLTTPVSHEVFTFLRRNYEGYGQNGKPINRKTHADIHPGQPIVAPFYRAEGSATFRRLPEVRPSVFYIFGELSTTSTTESNNAKLNRTGIGFSGNGGVKEGRVSSVTLKNIGHLIPMEAVETTAEYTAEWIGKEMVIWRADREERERNWVSKSLTEKQEIEKRWKDEMGGPPKRKMKDSKI